MSRSEIDKLIRLAKGNNLLLVGAGVGVIYWILDSIVISLVFRESAFITQFLSPEVRVIWRRALVIGLILAFSVYINFVTKRNERTDADQGSSEEHYQWLMDRSPTAIGIQDQDKFVFVNSAGIKLLCAEDANQLIGKHLWDFVPPEDREDVKQHFRMISDNVAEVRPIDLTLRCMDGTLAHVEVLPIPLIYENKPAIQIIIRDRSKRNQAEEEVRQRNIELATLNAIASTVSQSLDLDKTINNALDEVMQLDVLGPNTKGMLFLLEEKTNTLVLTAHRGTPGDHPCLASPPRVGECLCGLAIQQAQPVISLDCFTDQRHTRTWHNMPHHKDICLPLKARGKMLGAMNVRLPEANEVTDKLVELLSSVADQISVAIENARLFEAVDNQRKHLRVLSQRLAEAEDTERRRLARELHDQVGQNLTALGINLNLLRTQISERDAKQAWSCVDESLALVDQTTERIRDVMMELRPPMLDEYGLVATLQSFSAQFAKRVGLSVTVQGDEHLPRLSAGKENVLFRIATEALTNVAKHARATQVTISIDFEDDTMRLVIMDDGVGFDPTGPTDQKGDRGWGLLNMVERAEAVGGQCWIESQPSRQGTRVIAEIPR